MNTSLVQVHKDNLNILLNLGQAYEAEFSTLTGKNPNKNGLFELDAIPNDAYVGYLLYQEQIPIGFCVANVISNPKDIAEFYILPSMRRKQLGISLAHQIFKAHPGKWQVRQIQGADHAIKFWRHAISLCTNNNYNEEITEDPHWGMVTKQTFTIDASRN